MTATGIMVFLWRPANYNTMTDCNESKKVEDEMRCAPSTAFLQSTASIPKTGTVRLQRRQLTNRYEHIGFLTDDMGHIGELAPS